MMNTQTLSSYAHNILLSSEDWGVARYGTGTVAAGETSDAIVGLSGDLAAHVAITAGTVEYTVSPLSAITGDTALWVAWPHGEVSSNTADSAEPGITGLRFTAPAGTGCTWEVRG